MCGWHRWQAKTASVALLFPVFDVPLVRSVERIVPVQYTQQHHPNNSGIIVIGITERTRTSRNSARATSSAELEHGRTNRNPVNFESGPSSDRRDSSRQTTIPAQSRHEHTTEGAYHPRSLHPFISIHPSPPPSLLVSSGPISIDFHLDWNPLS